MLILACIYYLTIAALASLTGGIIAIAYSGYTILDTRKKEHEKERRAPTKTRFFINIAIANWKDVKSKHKSSSSSMSKSVKKAITKKITKSSGGSSSSSDDLMRQICSDVIEWIQTDYLTIDEKEHKDVDIMGDVALVRGEYAVIGMTLQSVNALSVIRRQISGEENKDRTAYMDNVIGFLSKFLGEDFVQFALNSQIKEVIKRELVSSLGEDVKAHLKGNWSAKAEVVVTAPEEQSVLYFDLLRSCSEDEVDLSSGDVVVKALQEAAHTGES